ncbi:MAG: 3'-5' exonuclease [Minisyncoccota bacterium]
MIVADIEASGLDYRNHALLSIGAVDFENPERQFYGECRAWEGAHLDPEALAVNGFTETECLSPGKESLEELMARFHHWVEQSDDRILAGHNVSFDRDFLNNSFQRTKINFAFPFRTIDLHTLAYTTCRMKNIPIPQRNGHPSLSLDTIMRLLGLPEEPKPHVALMGAKVAAEAFSRLMYEKNLLPEFSGYPMQLLEQK